LRKKNRTVIKLEVQQKMKGRPTIELTNPLPKSTTTPFSPLSPPSEVDGMMELEVVEDEPVAK